MEQETSLIVCPLCYTSQGYHNAFMGQLGRLYHFKCIACGIPFSSDSPPDDDGDTQFPGYPAEIYDVSITVKNGFATGIGRNSHVPTYLSIELDQPFYLTDELSAERAQELFESLFRELFQPSADLAVSVSFDD